MLTIYIPEFETFENNTFTSHKAQTLHLEHSLYSIAKWESEWHLPFLDTHDKSSKMIRDYVRKMTLDDNVDPYCYFRLTQKDVEAIAAYINDPMTATKITEDPNTPKKAKQGKFITAEEIYYMMIALQIPFECQYWHFSRLMTLIRVCSIKNAPAKKMNKKAQAMQNHALNAKRKKALHTKG